MSYDSGSDLTMGMGGGGGTARLAKAGEHASGPGGGGLAPTGTFAAPETDTFTSPPFRGGVRSPYNTFGDHADVVAEHYEQVRRLSHGGGASPMGTSQQYQFANTNRRDGGGASPTGISQQYQFANTSRRGSGDGVGGGGLGGGAADMSVRVPKRSRSECYYSDDDVMPTRAFGAGSPGTKRYLSEMMASNLLVGLRRYCSPRHRMPFNSRNDGSKWRGGRWAWHMLLAAS